MALLLVPLFLGILWDQGLLVLVGALPFAQGAYGLGMCLRTFPMPSGEDVKLAEAPLLASWLEELRASWFSFRGRGIQLVRGGWTLDLVGPPALGLLGWLRLRWRLGVFALLALGDREFEALASCELVWWSHQQPWLNLQVKRLSLFWRLTAQRLEAEAAAGTPLWNALIHRILRRYARFVNLQLEPFLVGQVLDADQSVARAYGAPTLARALCRLAVLPAVLDRRVYPAWTAERERGGRLPEHLHHGIREAFQRHPEASEAILANALAGQVPEAPALLQLRLEALGEAPAMPIPAEGRRLLEALDDTGRIEALEAAWRRDAEDHLSAVEAAREAERTRLEELEARRGDGPPAPQDLYEHLRLACLHGDRQVCQDLLAEALAQHPEDGTIRQTVLQQRLRSGELEGLEPDLEAFRDLHPYNRASYHELRADYLARLGDLSGQEAALGEAHRAQQEAEEARRERATLRLQEATEPHGLEPEALERLREQLAAFPDAGAACLVRKPVQVLPDLPAYLLVIRWKGMVDGGSPNRRAFQDRLARSLTFPFPSVGFVLAWGPWEWHLRRHWHPQLGVTI